jgi:hypothetical protein
MDGFEIFRSRRVGYFPRTPAAALKAVGAGNLPAEHFIHASASAKPLDEEPFDLDEIERVLARPDANLATSVLLKRVLTKLIGNREQEVALFGAEGINALESRALMRVEELKARIPPRGGRRVRGQLARAFYELAELHAGAESVRSFYLRAAYAHLRSAIRGRSIARSELALAVDILIALRQYAAAARLLDRVSAASDPDVLLLAARVAFKRADYVRVAECCRRLAAAGDGVAVNVRRAVSFWAAGHG